VASGIVLLRSPSTRSTTLVLALGADGNADCGHGRDDCVERDEFSFGNRGAMDRDAEAGDEKAAAAAAAGGDPSAVAAPTAMPPTSVMTRLILIMVWRKLIRNPNTYSSLIGVIWSLVCFRSVPVVTTNRYGMHASALARAGDLARQPIDSFAVGSVGVLQVELRDAGHRPEIHLHPVGRGARNGHVQSRAWLPFQLLFLSS